VNVRPWRDPAELEGRDLRPGHFSVTGEFIRLSDQAEDSHLNREEPRHVGQ
jgi:hypothetical protein